mmetsp:Transcript_11628/g.33473  ORF Transcript_11628/g.33473 Transcript_11628/m.33473 type:complete len:217 (+) Transcript_11628:1088-1738(+)
MYLFLCVHLGKVGERVVQRIGPRRVHSLLGLHGGLHDGVVGLECLDVVLVARKDVLLDALAQAVFANGGDDLATVIFLGIDPPNDLVHRLQVSGGVQVLALDHGFSNGGGVLLQFLDHGGVVKDSTGNLTVSSSQAKNQVQRGFLLDVVVTQGASVLQLLSGKDETLLVGRNPLLVLDLGFDIVDGVRGFHVQGDGLSGQGLYKNLHLEYRICWFE